MTKYDYWCKSHMFFLKQNPCLDLDMIYGNFNTKEMYVFDKDGTWVKEGVNHPNLSLESTFNEANWYDEFNPINNGI